MKTSVIFLYHHKKILCIRRAEKANFKILYLCALDKLEIRNSKNSNQRKNKSITKAIKYQAKTSHIAQMVVVDRVVDVLAF